jgi:hypothetical protein
LPAPGGHLLDTPDRNVDKGKARVIIFGKGGHKDIYFLGFSIKGGRNA